MSRAWIGAAALAAVIGLAACGGQIAAQSHPSQAAAQVPSPAPTPSPTPSLTPAPVNGGYVQYSDGTRVSVSSVQTGTLSEEGAGGNPGDPTVTIFVKVVAGSAAIDASQIIVDVNGGPDGVQLSQVFDSSDQDPDGQIDPGQSGTYGFEFDTAGDGGPRLQITVEPGFSYANATFTGVS